MNEPVSLHIRGAARKRFAVEGNPNNIIEINTSDTGILERLQTAYKDLYAMGDRATEIKSLTLDIGSEEDIGSDKVNALLTELADIDKKMRGTLDNIFDSPIADACSAGGKMYDPVDGEFRFDVILSDLMAVMQEDLHAEFDKVIKRREEHMKAYKGKRKN